MQNQIIQETVAVNEDIAERIHQENADFSINFPISFRIYYANKKNKQERGSFMRKSLKKGIGTLLFCILIAEGVTACGGPASSSTTTAKVDETGTREVEEEVKVNEKETTVTEEEVQKGCTLAAKEYIDSQMPEEKDNINNFSTPSVVLLDKEPEGYYECIKNYKTKGKIFKVIFNTKDDAVLGPIVCFVDEKDVVFGLGWRE